MISRRFFLKSSALTAAAALLLKHNAFALSPAKLKFGFISGIIGKELDGDWKAVLKKTVDYGFSEIEIGEYLGESASEFLLFCKNTGLTPVAGNLPFNEDDEKVKKTLEGLSLLGIKYPVIYWPWVGGGPFKLEDCKRTAGILNHIGEICKNNGMVLCWHNHDKEFVPMEEGIPFDYLMEHTDKELVKCELDVYWVTKGGADPVTFLKKYTGRYRILHLKDMTGDDRRTFECVGSGIIDFPTILKEARGQGIEHFMLEYDNVVDGMGCLKTSGEYLKSLSL
jgi:sugar phosphate isomerase/epimerase